MSVSFQASAPLGDNRGRVRRRVFYVPGYAADGVKRHRDLFAREAGRFGALWGVEVESSPLRSDPGQPSEWTTRTRMEDVDVETTVETLAWDDLVAVDFRASLPLKLLRGLATLVDGLISGTLWRVIKAAPWFAFAWVYPYLWLISCLGLGVGAGVFVAERSGEGWGVAAGLLAGVLVAGGALWALQLMPLYVTHLLDDWIAQRRYRRGRDLPLERRLDAFAARLQKVAADGTDDEIVVVGHSSGSFLAIDVVARAFEADPELGRHGPRITLLTLGCCELLVALHPDAGWFRRRMARLAHEESLFWAEVVARFDVLNFARRSPVAELGIAEGAPNPLFRRVKLNRLLLRPTVLRLVLGLRVFRIHFQFVMANERQADYDFFSLICGARPVSEQFARPRKQPMDPFPSKTSAAFAQPMTVL